MLVTPRGYYCYLDKPCTEFLLSEIVLKDLVAVRKLCTYWWQGLELGLVAIL